MATRIVCGQRCELPASQAHCLSRCHWDKGHDGLCACPAHVTNQYAPPVVEVADTACDSFPLVIAAAADRGLGPMAAANLWSNGVRSCAFIRAASWEALAPSVGRLRRRSRSRARDPPRAASSLPKLRADHPTIEHTKRGSKDVAFGILATNEGRDTSLRNIDSLVDTTNSKKTNDSLWTTWKEVLRVWGHEPLPLDPEKVRLAAAAFRAGGYRSAEPYFLRAKAEHIRTYDRDIGPATEDAIKRYSRAVERGVGPTNVKDGFMLERISAPTLDPDDIATRFCESLSETEAVWPEALVILGSWWMTRGIEASAARLSHIRLGMKNLTVSWCLPASKTDTKALGAERTHRCTCSEHCDEDPFGEGLDCPYHVASANCDMLRQLFPNTKDELIPFFPDRLGRALSKVETVAAIRSVLTKHDITTTREVAGTTIERYGEHALRVAGAQFFARAGHELYVIQLNGRWGSMAISRYIQDSPLTNMEQGRKPKVSVEDIINLIKLHSGKDTHKDDIEDTHEKLVVVQAQLSKMGVAIDTLTAKAEATKEDSKKPQYVKNLTSNKVHLVLVAPAIGQASLGAMTWCGWSFMDSPHASVDGPGLGPCKRCFRELRAATLSDKRESSGSSSASSSDV